MKHLIAACMTASICLTTSLAAMAATTGTPTQTVNVTPNQQTTQATAVSNPTGENISQQNNFSDPGTNSFGPGIQCSGPYITGSTYRNDASNPGSIGSGSIANTGGTIGLVIPLNGTNKKCEEFANEIVFQKQIDTCLAMMKQGFSFDPNGQYAYLAKRCQGIHYTGPVSANVNPAPISPPPPPTVITVPAIPGQHAQVLESAPSPASIAGATPAGTRVVAHASYCQKIDDARKKHLIAKFRANVDRASDLDELHAACVSDSEILSAI